MAALARAAVKEHSGIREEKSAELGLQPFRSRKLKLAAKETAPQTPAPEKLETSTLPPF